MTTVAELVPGDLVQIADGAETATFFTRTQHPIWPHLQLVIWKMGDGRWSLDALSIQQEIGDVVYTTKAGNGARLRRALLP